MIIKTIGCRGTQHFQTNPYILYIFMLLYPDLWREGGHDGPFSFHARPRTKERETWRSGTSSLGARARWWPPMWQPGGWTSRPRSGQKKQKHVETIDADRIMYIYIFINNTYIYICIYIYT